MLTSSWHELLLSSVMLLGASCSETSDGCCCCSDWQFQHRLWLARRYNYIREEVAFLFGYCWSVLRPIAFELNRRLLEAGIFEAHDDVFYCVTQELRQAISARKQGGAHELAALAAERRALRETQKQHHPPGTVPEEVR